MIPGDVLVCDGDGVVVIPRALVEEVAAGAALQETLETFVQERIRAGYSVTESYPPNAETLAAFEAWKAGRGVV